MPSSRYCYSVALLAALASKTAAFTTLLNGRISTNLYGTTKEPPSIPMPKDISYGEESRKYRRTVYTHDDWVKHRSPDRFLRNTISTITSGIYKNIANEVLFVTAVATVLVVGNSITGTYQDFSGVTHDGFLKDSIIPALSLPMNPFTLSSGSLGLLLVFRTNKSYQRWDEARKNWGMNINHTRDLVRMGTAWYDSRGVSKEKREEDLNMLALATWSFVRAMKRHLSPVGEDEEDFKKELYEKLPKDQAEAIINAAHRPNRALFDLSVAIENLPMHWMRKNEINKAVTIFEDNLGSSERLLTSPVPLFYSRHTARFLFFWLTALPLALYDSFGSSWNHVALIPSIAVLSTFMFGIEELANQLEEPFTILPMQAFCDKIYNWCMEIVSWEAGDNGMPQPLQQPKTVSIDSKVDFIDEITVDTTSTSSDSAIIDEAVITMEVPIANGEVDDDASIVSEVVEDIDTISIEEPESQFEETKTSADSTNIDEPVITMEMPIASVEVDDIASIVSEVVEDIDTTSIEELESQYEETKTSADGTNIDEPVITMEVPIASEEVDEIASSVSEEVEDIDTTSIEELESQFEEIETSDEFVEVFEDPAVVMKEQFPDKEVNDTVEPSNKVSEDPVVNMKAFSGEVQTTSVIEEIEEPVTITKEEPMGDKSRGSRLYRFKSMFKMWN